MVAPENEVIPILEKEPALRSRKLDEPKILSLKKEIELVHQQKLCGHSRAHSLHALDRTIL